jgi:hypothetical protein
MCLTVGSNRPTGRGNWALVRSVLCVSALKATLRCWTVFRLKALATKSTGDQLAYLPTQERMLDEVRLVAGRVSSERL